MQQQPLLLPDANEAPLSYLDLIAYLNQSDNCNQFFQPDSIGSFIKGFLLRIINGFPIVLMDADLESASVEAIKKLVGEDRYFKPFQQLTGISDLLHLIRESKSVVTIFTSGTTGTPKGVEHSVRSLIRTVRINDNYSNNVWGFAYSYTHMGGLQVLFQCILNANPMVNLFQKPKENILALINAFNVTHISATPTFFRLLIPSETVCNSVLRLSMGGEKSNAKLHHDISALFPYAVIHNIYASTEAGALLHSKGEYFQIPPDTSHLMKIIDGELWIHESALGKSSAILIKEGWYNTGDLVVFKKGSNDLFSFESRNFEIINVGGNKVNPHEIEEVLNNFSGIKSSKVYCRANSVLGNILLADVMLSDDDLSEKNIREYLNENLQSFKVPRIIKFVKNLDITRSGKLKRS